MHSSAATMKAARAPCALPRPAASSVLAAPARARRTTAARRALPPSSGVPAVRSEELARVAEMISTGMMDDER